MKNMVNDDDLLKYFPFESFRVGQKESIKKIINAFEDGYKYVILDASVGSGKSAVARAVIDYFNVNKFYDAFLLSSTKMLQNQYYDESLEYNKFNIDYSMGKGRSNFDCLLNNNPCSEGECKVTTDNHFKCEYGLHDSDEWLLGSPNGVCPYWKQKEKAVNSDVCILNYDVLLSDIPRHYKNRDLMVCDEAHNLDSKIMNRISITLSESRLNEYGVNLTNDDFKEYNTNIDYWIKRLSEIKTILVKNSLNEFIEGDFGKEYFSKKQSLELNDFIRKIENRLKEIKDNKNQWFVDIVRDRYGDKITIKPIDISQYAKPYLLDKAEYHLLMSGSIVDYRNFIKYLGLDKSEVYYIQQESSFDMVSNNPLVVKYCGKLTYNEKQKTLPKTYTVIEEILNTHKDKKGIIHCNSREFANKIIENCDSNNRFITYRNSYEKELAIKSLKESSNKVIVAYSLEEGLDLPNDDIRFQVLFKCPFPNLGDKQVKARQQKDYVWYLLETIRKVIQIVGRGMRHEDDYCVNYLIDSSFKQVFNNKYCPKYLKNSVQKKNIRINGKIL